MPKSVAQLDQRKIPLQGRSAETIGIILKAAEVIIEAKGLDALNTNLVAERAGVSVGSLYQYFPGKEAILATLIRNMRRKMLEDIEGALERCKDMNLAVTIHDLIHASLAHHVANPVLTQALEKAEDALPMNAETQALKHKMGGAIQSVLRQHGVPNPEQATFDLVAMSHGLVEAASKRGQTDFDDLANRLLRAVLGYLGLHRHEAGL
jgi:AcrR family transcriptional regulator